MKSLNYSQTIEESDGDLQILERQQKSSQLRDRVRFIRCLKNGTYATQSASGAAIGLEVRQSQRLWAKYQKGGMAKLLEKKGGKTVGKLSFSQMGEVQNMLRNSAIGVTQEQVAEWIEAQFGVRYTQSGICRLFERFHIKLKTGRPSNIRKDEAKAADFKKNLAF